MSGEDIVFWILGTTAVFVVGYVLWPVVRESRLAYQLWVWMWKRRQ